jgi:DNA-binding NarL/FixJ family response regulator
VRRVLVVDNQILMGAGVQSLLGGQADLELVGISPCDQAELAGEIRRLRPDLVVLDRDSQWVDPTRLLAALQDYPKLCLVVVSADDNLVCIYDKQQVLTSRAHDLLGIIRKR